MRSAKVDCLLCGEGIYDGALRCLHTYLPAMAAKISISQPCSLRTDISSLDSGRLCVWCLFPLKQESTVRKEAEHILTVPVGYEAERIGTPTLRSLLQAVRSRHVAFVHVILVDFHSGGGVGGGVSGDKTGSRGSSGGGGGVETPLGFALTGLCGRNGCQFTSRYTCYHMHICAACMSRGHSNKPPDVSFIIISFSQALPHTVSGSPYLQCLKFTSTAKNILVCYVWPSCQANLLRRCVCRCCPATRICFFSCSPLRRLILILPCLE